jgi:hypothetical protein
MALCTISKVITVERSERRHIGIQGNREWVTIIECVSSKGIPTPPVVILKAKEHQAAWYQEARFPQEWLIATIQNGWTTGEIGLRWLEDVFEPYSRRYSTGAKWLLSLDGPSSHLTREFDIFSEKNAIIYLCMPPHTSHPLQPLGDGVFGPLKRAYGKLIKRAIVARNNHIDKKDFLHLYPPARERIFNQENICSGLAGARLKPLNQDRVL